MNVNTSFTIDVKAMIHLDKKENKSNYINKLILKDISLSEEADGLPKE